MRSCWRKPGRRRWTTGARDPRVSTMLACFDLELELELGKKPKGESSLKAKAEPELELEKRS